MAYQAPSESRDDAAGRHADRQSEAHRLLSGELVEALIEDPTRVVWTPGFKHYVKPRRAVDVFIDHMNSDAFALALLKLLTDCQRTADPLIRMQAMAIYAEAGKLHADWHSEAVE